MILGQVIRAPNGAAATYYGPWFPRQGTKAVFACNHINSSEVSSLQITVQTKRAEDDNRNDSIEEVGSAASISVAAADSVTTFERGNTIDGSDGSGTFGFRDLVRFKYVLTSNASKKSWIHLRMLSPTWETD